MESEVKIQQETMEKFCFMGKNCVQNSLFWPLNLLIYCGLYLYFEKK